MAKTSTGRRDATAPQLRNQNATVARAKRAIQQGLAQVSADEGFRVAGLAATPVARA